MRKNDIYKGKYIKAQDLPKEGQTLTVDFVEKRRFDNGEKAVIVFKETEQQFVLNATNWSTIEQILGTDETNEWEGSKIHLIPTTVEFQGKIVPTVRVRHTGYANTHSESRAATADSDIPF